MENSDMACRIRIKLQRSEVGGQRSRVGRSHEVKKISIFGSLAESNGFSGDVLSDSRRIKEDTMLTRCLILIGLLIAGLLIFSGCGTKETMLSRNWGNSFESAKQSQILNPEAGKNLDTVVGLDGQAAENTMEKYRQGFKKEKSNNLGTITINNK